METILILHDIRSTHNVGSMLRTAECFGVKTVYITGYSPYPLVKNDPRLPHIAQKLHKAIIKTSLGAEQKLDIIHHNDIYEVLRLLKKQGFTIISAEQSSTSQNLTTYSRTQKCAVLMGREVEGISNDLLKQSDVILEIPMKGTKESFNVSVAAGIILYQLTCKS